MPTKRENCTRAIECGGPCRLPMLIGVHLWWLYEQDSAKLARIQELQVRMENTAIIVPGRWFDGEHTTADGVDHWTDEWGTGWEDDGHGAKT